MCTLSKVTQVISKFYFGKKLEEIEIFQGKQWMLLFSKYMDQKCKRRTSHHSMLNRNKNMANMNQKNFFAISWSRKLFNLMCMYVWAHNFYTQLGRGMQYAVLTTLSCLESKTIRRQKATQLHRTSQFTDAFNFGEKKTKQKNWMRKTLVECM